MSDYAVEIKVRNGRVLRLMRAAGISNASELARRSGVSPTDVSRILNLKRTPLHAKTGKWIAAVIAISDALHCLPDDMFSEAQRLGFMENNRAVLEMSEAEVGLLLEGRIASIESPEAIVARDQARATIEARIGQLPQRTGYILREVFGLDGAEPRTASDVADELGLCRARTAQLVQSGLRKLRGNKAQGRSLRAALDAYQ